MPQRDFREAGTPAAAKSRRCPPAREARFLRLGNGDRRLEIIGRRPERSEAGVFVYDAASADGSDAQGYKTEAEIARRLGYVGKNCIHPSQVPLAHQVFRPSDTDLAHARRVVEAARATERRGVGACMVDGHIVDGNFVRRAEAIIADAMALGLAAAEGNRTEAA